MTKPQPAACATRVLVVEDSKFFSNLVKKSIVERIGATVVTALSLAETKTAIEQAEAPFTLALVDVVLPDCHEGEAIEWLRERGVPCIVFTSLFSEDLRERVLAQNVIDYVVKDTPSSLEYLVNLTERIVRNRHNKILVVDDSKTARRYIQDLLVSYQFQVVAAGSGAEGLKALADNPDIQMVITDYRMPDMDGVELVKRIRQDYNQDRLTIIGISSGGGNALSAKFIKFGANDFINKPFLREEFFCRVMQNIKMLELVQQLKDLATTDSLTGLHNRRFLLDAGESLFANAKRCGLNLTVAMVDVDFFKTVNDTHGHDAGDSVLKRVATLLRHLCGRQADIVARFGGEEFAILSLTPDKTSAAPFFEKLRAAIEAEDFTHDAIHFRITASFGVCNGIAASLDDMLKQADALLYRAKLNGRNRVEIS